MEHAPRPRDGTDFALLLRISQLFKDGMSGDALYDITRGVWKVSKLRREKAKFAMAVYKGVIKEVYKIDSWEPAETAKFAVPVLAELAKQKRNRWAFIGDVAPEPEHSRYIGRSVANLFPMGAVFPVLGVNLDD